VDHCVRQFGPVGFAAQVRQHDSAELVVEQLYREASRSVVAEMPMRRSNARLHDWRIGRLLQQYLGMVRLKHQQVAVGEGVANALRRAPQIGGDTQAASRLAIDESYANGIGRVMCRDEGFDDQRADGKGMGRAVLVNDFAALEQLCGCIAGWACQMQGSAVPTSKDAHAAGVVAVIVRDDDAVKLVGVAPDRCQSPREVASTEARIDQDSGVPGLDVDCIARAARPQYGDLHGAPAW